MEQVKFLQGLEGSQRLHICERGLFEGNDLAPSQERTFSTIDNMRMDIQHSGQLLSGVRQ
jgi:hypothetical protein